MITVLSQEFGIPLTKEDLFIQKHPLHSFSPLALQKSRKVTIKQGAMPSLLDNHNEKYIRWKKDMEDKMQPYKDHIQVSSVQCRTIILEAIRMVAIMHHLNSPHTHRLEL